MNLGGLETNYQEFLLSENPGQNIWNNSAFPRPPITMLIFHSPQNQDLFIDRSHVSTLSGGKGARKRQRKKITRW